MSCPSPARLPRSLHESPAYQPDLRYLQVSEYLRQRRRLNDEEGIFILPSSERDSLVRAYFKLRTGITGPKDGAFRYAQDCDDSNESTWMGSRIKAMSVAGTATAEIARRLHTSVENIEMFQQLFFDIADYVSDPIALGAILAPMLDADSPVQRQERLWLQAALKMGANGLDYVMNQRVKLSAAEQKEISDSIHSILAEQSLAYTLSLPWKGEPTGDVLDYYQKSLDSRLNAPAVEDNSKLHIYQQGIGRSARRLLEEQQAAREAAGISQVLPLPTAR